MYRKRLRVFALAALIVCLAAGFIYWITLDNYRFEESGFYPANGMKYVVNAGDKAEFSEDKTFIKMYIAGKDPVCGDELCMYVDDRDAVVLTCIMGLVAEPVDDKINLYRLPCYTDVQRNPTNIIYTTTEHQYVGGGLFMYNGDDTYIVLESATLIFGDKAVSLSPLSYVIACNDQWVQYYDYSRDEYKIEYIDPGTSVEIIMDNWDFTILANLDRARYKDTEFMFISSVEYLENFFDYNY